MQRDRLTESEARQRIAAQLPAAEKIPRATFVIDTDGTIAETDKQIEQVRAQLVGGR
jgi:dephospho-CoA kinase